MSSENTPLEYRMNMRPLRTRISKENLSIIGIPSKFHSSTLEDFHTYNTESLRMVKDFFQDYISDIPSMFENNKGIFLHGSNGVGKTMLSCILLKETYRHRYSCGRLTFIDYCNLYTAIWGARNQDDKDDLTFNLYHKAKGVEFLVLEEVGKEVDSKIAAPILEDCLRYREDKGLVTIICTNLKLSVMKEKYGQSCLSLMQGNMTPICIESADKRKYSFDNKEI